MKRLGFLLALLAAVGTASPVEAGFKRLRPTYDPDAQRYFAQAAANGCAAGSAVWKASVNNLVVWMKAKSLWPTPSTGFDAVYLWAVPDTCTGRINLVFPTQKNLTISGTCTFVAYRSIRGNAVDCVLSTGVFANAFVRYLQDSAHVSAWTLNATAFSGTSIGLDGSTRTQLNHFLGNLRLNGTTTITDTGISVSGFYAADRDNSANIDSYFNGAAKSVDVPAVSSVRQSNAVVLLKNNAVFQDTEISFAAIGSTLTPTKEADWYTGVRTFLLANAVPGVS